MERFIQVYHFFFARLQAKTNENNQKSVTRTSSLLRAKTVTQVKHFVFCLNGAVSLFFYINLLLSCYISITD